MNVCFFEKGSLLPFSVEDFLQEHDFSGVDAEGQRGYVNILVVPSLGFRGIPILLCR